MTERTPEMAELQEAPLRPESGIRGSSGTPRSSQWSAVETNGDLTGTRWAHVVRDMMLDPSVSASWMALKHTLLSASWRWESGDDGDPFADKLAEFAAHVWSEMDTPWEHQLSYLLEYVPVGARYAEEVYRVDGEAVMLKGFYDREMTAHSQWVRDENGDLAAVTQSIWSGSKAPQPIPASKLLLLTLNLTGQNFAGVGLCRPMYFPWKMKAQALDNTSLMLERWGVPPVVVEVDRQAGEDSGYTPEDIDAQVSTATDEAEALVACEQSVMVATNAVKYSALDMAQSNSAVASALSVIQELDNQIMTAAFVQFLRLGVSDSGSRGVAEVHETFFRRLAVDILDHVAGAICGRRRPGGGTMDRLIYWNFGHVEASKLPRLVHDGLDVSPLSSVLSTLPGLVTAGMLTPDNSTERAIRDAAGLDELGSDDERDTDERMGVASPLAAAFGPRGRR